MIKRFHRRRPKPARYRCASRADAVRANSAENVTDFGAFVSLGDDVTGLIHISQLSSRRLGHPTEVVNVDDSVMVTVLKVDMDAERVSLKLKTESRTRRL
jgi:ribosomal protein S1